MSVEEQAASSDSATDRPIDDSGRDFTTELQFICTAWTATAILAGLGLIAFGDTLADLIV